MGKTFSVVQVICGALLAVGCGSGSSSSSSSSLGWAGSGNGAVVLDANGSRFLFSSSSGCAQPAAGGPAPSGFCLTSSTATSSGFANSGATNCTSPSSNTQCDAASFAVVLTNDPAGSGCIAVLTDGSATQSTGLQALALTSNASGFSVETVAAPTAFAAYWSGIVPICGGSSSYAGNYSGTVSTTSLSCPSGYILSGDICCSQPANGTCLGGTTNPISTSMVTGTLSFAVDSGGQVNDDTAKIVGTLSGNAVGDVITEQSVSLNTNSLTYTVATASQGSNGKWTLAGTATAPLSGGPDSFSVVQQ